MDHSVQIEELCRHLQECTGYYNESLPLCAAENTLSDFCKIPLSGDFQERYIMGSANNFRLDGNFIGSQFLLPFYSMIQEISNTLFGARYADARPLSGMNCLTTLLMSLTDLNDKIAILPAAWGGHPSVQPVCERLGLKVYHLPYDRLTWDIDYERANELLDRERITYILLAPSDIIHPPAVERFDLSRCKLLYDISQVMGLIAGGMIPCPINLNNTVLFGGTHKTLPGPASGLIMTNDEQLYYRMEDEINPKYIRHTQMHQVISLLFALLEFECYGNAYAKCIVKTSNILGYYLEEKGFRIGKVSNNYSETHQLFLFCNPEEMDRISKNAIHYGVTLNKKQKALFGNTGIRLGTQEIARYEWSQSALRNIGNIIYELAQKTPDDKKIRETKNQLPPKMVQFTFPEEIQQQIRCALHKE